MVVATIIVRTLWRVIKNLKKYKEQSGAVIKAEALAENNTDWNTQADVRNIAGVNLVHLCWTDDTVLHLRH